MNNVIEALQTRATEYRALAERSRKNAAEASLQAGEWEREAAEQDAHAQECEVAIAKLSPPPTAVAA